MSLNTRVFIVNSIKLSINASFEEAFSVAEKRLKKIGANTKTATFSIYKKSIDARNKSDIKFVYSVAVSGNFPEISDRILKVNDISLQESISAPIINFGNEIIKYPPLVVGSGPCGLFSALLLAENGYKPTLIERGGNISERNRRVNEFYLSHKLDLDTNIQFGAGGAGTFSDGKLITRINDPYSFYVMTKLVEFGAPEEILYSARPHIGTDILSPIVEKIISKIELLGGKVLFYTKYIDSIDKNGITVAKTSAGDIPYGALVLAIGHSARDTYATLIDNGYKIEAKPFSVGMRIEHLADDIDKAMYGDFAGHKALGHAEYNLSHNTKERGVYTFCMCPGGEVVAAASESGGVVVNGMSRHNRNGKNSNSAVLCSIFKEDYGNTPEKAIAFQRMIETAAFKSCGGSYIAPIITVGDFMSGKCVSEPRRILPTYMNSTNVKLCSPEKYLPGFVCDSIKGALVNFDKKIKGFASGDAILTGAETRSSAPIRILRDPESRIAFGTDNIYPCGEGAGYAGGITSAAIDGIKTAISIMKRFKP